MVMMAEAPAMARGLETRKESFTYDAEIERDRKALLLKSVRSTTAATIGAAFIVLVHFWSLVGHIPLILWSALTIAVGVFRFAVVRQAGESPSGDVLETAHNRTIAGTAAAMVMWIAGLPLFGGGAIADLMVPGFLYIILCCAGTVSLSVYKRAFLIFVPPIITAIVAVILSRRYAGPLAYVSGSLGVLIGADLSNLNKVADLGAPVASIGGAGTFDGIFLTGVLAVLLASLTAPRYQPALGR